MSDWHRYQKNIFIESKKHIYRIKQQYLLNQKRNIRFAMKSLGIPSRVGGRSSGPLVLWSAGPLVLWSALVRWSCHQICTPMAHKVLHLPPTLHFHIKNSSACHEICTPRPQSPAPATKSALQGPQSPVPATKSALQGPQSPTPTTKSALQGPQKSPAPATKSALQGP